MKYTQKLYAYMLSAFAITAFVATSAGSVRAQVSESEIIDVKPSVSLNRAELPDGTAYVAGEVIVGMKSQSGRSFAQGFDSLESKYSVSGGEEVSDASAQVLKFDEKEIKIEELIAQLEQDPQVEYAQPNFLYSTHAMPGNDTLRGLLWGLDNTGQVVNGVTGTNDADIDLPEAWAATGRGDASIIVAVIDTGVDYFAADLTNQMWNGSSCVSHTGAALGGCIYGYDFGNMDKDPYAMGDSHGTHVAGTIAAQYDNGIGVAGVAPNVDIMALKVSWGGFANFITTTALTRAINFADANGARVINASLGSSSSSCSGYDFPLYNAIKNFDGIFVASAGNNTRQHGTTFNVIPADFGTKTSCWNALNNVISVAATTSRDQLAPYSDYSSSRVHIAAPGSNVLSTVIDGGLALSEDIPSSATPAGWSMNGNWRVGAASEFGIVSNNGGYGFYTDNAPYADGSSTNTYLTSPTIDLSGYAAAIVEFIVVCDTETGDPATTDYLRFEPYNGTSYITTYPRVNETTVAAQNTGVGLNFNTAYQEFALGSAYMRNDFRFQVRWATDGGNNSSGNMFGCYVDDIYVVGHERGFGYMDGTSMAAPHVAGVVALTMSVNTAVDNTTIKNAVLNTADQKSSLNGKVMDKRRLNAFQPTQALNAVAWGNFAYKDGQTADTPTLAEFDGKLYQTLRGNNGQIYTRSSDDGTNWTGFTQYGGTTLSAPAMVAFNGKLYQSVRANNGSNEIYMRSKASHATQWTNWKKTTGLTADTPTLMVSATEGRMYQVLRGANSKIYTRYTTDGTTWTGFSEDGGTTISSPRMVEFDGRLIQSIRGSNEKIYVRSRAVNTTTWTSWSYEGGSTRSAPDMVVFDGKLIQTVRGGGDKIYYRVKESNAAPWKGFWYISGTTIAAPSTAAFDGKLVQSVRGSNTKIYLRESN